MAERLGVGDQPLVARRLGRDEEIGERLAGEQLLLPPLQRPESRSQPRLGGEGGEQALGEGVDGLDSKPAAGGVEDVREQGARAPHALVVGRLAEREQLLPQRLVLEPHPVSEPRLDPPGHLGGAGLGEGEAEDGGRLDSREEQPKHPGSQHMGLARPGRSGEGGMVARARGTLLLRFQRRQRVEAMGHSTDCTPRYWARHSGRGS